MTAILTLGADERETLHRLLLRRLTVLAERHRELAEKEGVSFEQLLESFGDDLRLFDEVGLDFMIDRSAVDLTMPTRNLAATLRRLREDARRALTEGRHEREPEESAEERHERFRLARETCEELLERLGARD